VPESKNPAAGALDLIGVVLSTLGVGALVYGIIAGGDQNHWLTVGVTGPIVLGVVVLVLMVFVERKVSNPALDLSLFGSRLFSAGSISLALAMFTAMGGSYVLAFYLQVLRGYSPIEAGLTMVPTAIGTMFAAASSAKFVAKFGPRLVIAGGLLLIGLGLAYFATMDAGSWIAVFLLVQLVFGVGLGLVFAPAPAVCMSVVPPAKAGAGAAIPNTSRQVGAAIGIAVIGSVLGVAYRDKIGPALGGLPADLRTVAGGSIGDTLKAAAKSADPAALVSAAHDAFIAAQSASMWVGAGISVLAALLAFAWLPKAVSAPASSPKPDVAADGARESAEVN
jgi:hypothetical protein